MFGAKLRRATVGRGARHQYAPASVGIFDAPLHQQRHRAAECGREVCEQRAQLLLRRGRGHAERGEEGGARWRGGDARLDEGRGRGGQSRSVAGVSLEAMRGKQRALTSLRVSHGW